MDWKRNRLWVGLAALVAMGALAWYAVASSGGETPPPGEDEQVTLPEIERDAITQVEIDRPEEGEEPIRLVKDGETWRVAAPVEAPASTTSIDTMLEKLTGLEVRGIAASRAEHHARLEVDPEHAVHVIARAGDREVIDMWIGGSRGGNTLVRLDGDDRVLLLEGSIKFAFNKPVRDWRERAIVDVSPDDVRELTFTNTNGTYRFRKNESDWVLVTEAAEGQPAPVAAIENFDGGKVRTTVSSLARMRASDFAAADVTRESAGLGDSAARVVMLAGEGENQQTITVLVGNESSAETHDRYVMRDGDPTIYVVSRFLAERLIPNTAAFQRDPEAPAGEGGEGAEAPPGGMPGGGQLPPEIMEQIQRQLQAQGMGGGGH